MNIVVSLVNEWDVFEKKHPDGGIADFCRYYLINEKVEDERKMVKGMVPPSDEGLMMKTLGYITSAFGIYYRAAMAKTQLPFPEAFYFLNALKPLKEVRKTELVNISMLEYTTGMDMIGKLIKQGFIAERQHDTDKRAKLLSLTPKGEDVLPECYKYINMATRMMFKDMDSDTLKLCISLLSKVEIKHSALAIAVRHLDFEAMYTHIMETP